MDGLRSWRDSWHRITNNKRQSCMENWRDAVGFDSTLPTLHVALLPIICLTPAMHSIPYAILVPNFGFSLPVFHFYLQVKWILWLPVTNGGTYLLYWLIAGGTDSLLSTWRIDWWSPVTSAVSEMTLMKLSIRFCRVCNNVWKSLNSNIKQTRYFTSTCILFFPFWSVVLSHLSLPLICWYWYYKTKCLVQKIPWPMYSTYV